MQELMPGIRFQIGNGPLAIIADELCERKEGTDRSQCEIYLSGFQIATLDEKGDAIAGNTLSFQDESAPRIARLLALVMWDIAKGTIGLPVELDEYSITVDAMEEKAIRISRNSEVVIVPLENVTELGGKLAVVVGSTPYRKA
ncbi:MAG: hypothetical protein HPY61_02560 [Methanotrichaceae archaeon]|nr:hypothetical protein [Methanotrichaceae archaeon]